MNNTSEDPVSEGNCCPRCSERRIEFLVWIDDDNVRCTSCGTIYDPITGKEAA